MSDELVVVAQDFYTVSGHDEMTMKGIPPPRVWIRLPPPGNRAVALTPARARELADKLRAAANRAEG